jgi:hypothetical protein
MKPRLSPLLAVQRARLEADFPSAKIWTRTVLNEPALVFLLAQQPTPQNRQYWVRYTVQERGTSVSVIDPVPIKHFAGRSTPHLVADGSLCLYDHKTEEWSLRRPLAQLVQFCNRWLFHYEHWEVYGEWLGDHDGESWEAQLAALSVETAKPGKGSLK